jgi:hypothetical protein
MGKVLSYNFLNRWKNNLFFMLLNIANSWSEEQI